MQSWAVFLVLAAVYRWGRCPSFGPGESPRTVFRALHEPGWDPLARLGALCAKLPFDDAWGHVNAVSGLLHAAAAALLFATLRRAGAPPVAALAAVAALAFSRRYWYYALVAGRIPAAVFGLALIAYAPIPGAALLLYYGYRADSLAPLGLWALAFGAGLALREADPRLAYALLAAGVLRAVLWPYNTRRHNPTLLYAQTLLRGLPAGARVRVADETIEYAAKLVGQPGVEITRDADADYFEAVLPGDGLPAGLLVSRSGPAGSAEALLAEPALSSVGLRDLPRYGFTKESALYDRYYAALKRYEATAGDEALKAKISTQIKEYLPGRSS